MQLPSRHTMSLHIHKERRMRRASSLVPQEGRLIGEQIAFIRSLFPNDRLSETQYVASSFCSAPMSVRFHNTFGNTSFNPEDATELCCSPYFKAAVVVCSRSSSGLSQRVLTDCWISIDIRRLSTGMFWYREIGLWEMESHDPEQGQAQNETAYFSRRVSLSVNLRTCYKWFGTTTVLQCSLFPFIILSGIIR